MPTVVIADDSPTLRKIVGTVLERDGYTVVTAEDGVEAVQAVFRTPARRGHPRRPDAAAVAATSPPALLKDDWQTADIPVILLTSLDAATDRYWGAQAGADRFLTKDFEAPAAGRGRRARCCAARRRGARWPGPAACPDPVELGDDDVFARIVRPARPQAVRGAGARRGHLDRVGRASASRRPSPPCSAVLGRVVDYDLAAVLMLDDRSTYVTLARDTSHQQYAEFFGADRRRRRPGRPAQPVDVHDLVPAGRRPRRHARRRGRGRHGDVPVDAARGRAAASSACWRCPARPRTPSARRR